MGAAVVLAVEAGTMRSYPSRALNYGELKVHWCRPQLQLNLSGQLTSY